MKVISTALPDVLLITPDVYGDARGFFMESWNWERYQKIGIATQFVQDNLSFSAKGVLRGLHFQYPFGQGKLVSCLIGEVYDVAVDIRRHSPFFGQWVGVFLSAENHQQLYIPPGFAHGFCVTSDTALFSYKCTELYHPETEGSVAWDDPALAIPWPVTEPSLSRKDLAGVPLKDLDLTRLPAYEC